MFTQEQIKEIRDKLLLYSKKDTQFKSAKEPLKGNELLALVQDGDNVSIEVKDVITHLSEFINFDGSAYVGIASPNTLPITNNAHGIFYIALEKGKYEHFNNFELDGNRVAIFKTTQEDPHTWLLDLTEIRLDAITIAENARNIADSALTQTKNLDNNVKKLSDKVDISSEMAEKALKNSADAIDRASNSIPITDRGKAGGVPILDQNGLVPLSQLPIKEIELIDSYESDRIDAPPTAAALGRLHEFHEKDIITTKDILNAVLDLVGTTTDIGVAPTSINITSQSQSVKVQIICSGAWSVTELPANVTATPSSGTGNSTMTLVFPDNTSETEVVTGVIKVVNNYSKEKTISFTQQAASTYYVYNLTVDPTSINVPRTVGIGSFIVTSTKTPHINGNPVGPAEDVSYITSTPSTDTWLTINSDDKNSYSHAENNLEAIRVSKITVKQTEITPDGKTKIIEIPVTQDKAVISIRYDFSIIPTNLSIENNGIEKVYSAEIKSTKTTVINGKTNIEDLPYTISYTGEVNTSWVNYNKDAKSIRISTNDSENSREGAIVFSQDSSSGLVITVPITQQGAIVGYDYKFEYAPTEMHFGNSASTKQYAVYKSAKVKTINSIPVGDEIPVNYDTRLEGIGFILDKETFTISASENTEAERTGKLIFTRAELGQEKDIIVGITQDAGIVTYEYVLEANVNPTTILAKNGTTILTVKSTKQKKLNGTPVGNPEAVVWHASSSKGLLTGEDISGSTWVMQDNKTESSRQETLVISQGEDGGKQVEVKLSQSAGTISWEYTFNTNPTTLSFGKLGESKSTTVVSTRRKKINGEYDGPTESVPYTSNTTSGFSINGTTISVGENTSSVIKTGTATFTQSFSSKTATVNLSQEAGEVYNEYIYTVNPSSTSFPSTGGSRAVSLTSLYRTYINGKIVSESPIGTSLVTSTAPFDATLTSVSVGTNTTTSTISGSATYVQSGSGKQATVWLTQEAGIPTTEYSISFASNQKPFRQGETDLNAVYSKKITKVNGTVISSVDIPWAYNSLYDIQGRLVSGYHVSATHNPSSIILSYSNDYPPVSASDKYWLAQVKVIQSESGKEGVFDIHCPYKA